jgi:flagellar motility protein MotE (MotC chaperone)
MKGKLFSLQNLLMVGLLVKAFALVVVLTFTWPVSKEPPTMVLAQAAGQGDEITKAKGGGEAPDEPVKKPPQNQEGKDAAGQEAKGQPAEAGADQGGDKEVLDSRITSMIEQKQRELALAEERIQRERSELNKLRIEVNNRIAELKKVQAALEQLVVTERQERRKRIMQLVKVLSNMRPNSAGAVVAKLDDQMAVEIFSFMQSRQAGKVMAALDPEKAARISLLLTRKKQAEEAARVAGEAAGNAAPKPR